MRVIQTKDYEEMSKQAFNVIFNVINKNENAVINTTTGASYDDVFNLLVESINNNKLSIKNAIVMNLDEYIADRDKSFTVYTYMQEKFYSRIKTQPKLVELLDGSVSDLQSEIIRYNEVLKKFPRDLQILGLGVNGHLGANEPGTSFNSRLFCADSEESTIESTIRYHHLSRKEAPTKMFTLGLADIMEAKEILLTASGERKAKAVKAALEGPINVNCPASILRAHPNVTFIIDYAAASLLEKDYHNPPVLKP
ncbi:glucosamine-6-phosphate deaminase [Terrilactibacillus laevilacticus]|uniref:Glucosamine-6-phosphate deaminase n=1 Tax=Terrilactibacillus laevilacticus TaxID=1380157 RepID=A0ABW5PRL2_9BACI|nr:glucosamine-6-phosphate deaminase [Terrilactibacillus laevilacticus]